MASNSSRPALPNGPSTTGRVSGGGRNNWPSTVPGHSGGPAYGGPTKK